MKLGHNDAELFKDIETSYEIDHEPLSMFIVQVPVAQHS